MATYHQHHPDGLVSLLDDLLGCLAGCSLPPDSVEKVNGLAGCKPGDLCMW